MDASGQYTVAAIATTLGVSRASIYRHLAAAADQVSARADQRRRSRTVAATCHADQQRRDANAVPPTGGHRRIAWPSSTEGGGMEQTEIDRVWWVLRQRSKPPWRVLWQARPARPQASTGIGWAWRRRVQLQAGWELLWTDRLRRDLAPIYRLVACRRGRHRDAHIVADDLVGSALGDDYREVAICEVCGRAIQWPNGRPIVAGPGQE
jgi:hypothetical protein